MKREGLLNEDGRGEGINLRDGGGIGYIRLHYCGVEDLRNDE